MPPVLGAAAAAALTQFAISVAISVALTFVSRLLAPKPKSPVNQDRGIAITVRSSIEPRQITYGTDVVGGLLAFADTSGSSNQYLHLVIALNHGQIGAIDEVILDDTSITSAQLNASGVVTSGRFANKVRIKKHLGTNNQDADASLVSEIVSWTTNHRLRGVAYVYLRLEFDRDVFPTGIPSIRAKIRGQLVWDPRANPGAPSVKAFSDTASLCQLDWAMKVDGYNLGLTEIDETTWAAAANVCDEAVELANTGSPPETEGRYTCDGSFRLDRKRRDVMRDLLDASLGTIVWQQGSLRGYTASATVASDSFTVDDLRADIDVSAGPGRDSVFNAVRGTYLDETQRFIPTSFASVTNATYQADDNGERIWEDINLSFTKGSARAQRMAKLVLDLSRQGITVTWPCKLKKLNVAVWDTVLVTVDDLGWSEKKFRITDFVITPDGGIDLTLREEADALYTWDPADEVTIDPAPDTNLPNPFTVSLPTGLNVGSEQVATSGGDETFRISINWDQPADAFVLNGGRTELQWKENAASIWRPSWFVDGAETSSLIYMLELGISYDVRIRFVNSIGVRSAWSTLSDFTVTSPAGVLTELDYGEAVGSPTTDITDSFDYGEAVGSPTTDITATLDYGEAS